MIYLTRFCDKPVIQAIREVLDAGLVPRRRVINGSICLVGEQQ